MWLETVVSDLLQEGDATSSWLLIASTTTLAVVLVTFKFLKGPRCDEHAPPTASPGILQTIREFSGPDAPFFLLKLAQETASSIYRVNLPLPGGVYIVGDSAAQREIFLDSTTDKPGPLFKAFSKIGGTPNIFTRTTADPHWRYARKGSAPAFSSKEVNRMNRICGEHLERWIETVLEPLVKTNESFDASSEMIRLTFNIIMESAFEYTPTEGEYEEFVHHLEVALREFTFKQIVNPFRSSFGLLIPDVRVAMQSCYAVRRYAQKIIDNYRAKTDKSSQNTLIKLIEQNPNFPNDKVKVSELITYIVAGFDTTGCSLATTLVLLAKHPEVATKAHKSLQGLPPSKPSDYLRFVFLESNRLYPVAAMGSIREAGRGYTFTTTSTSIADDDGSSSSSPSKSRSVRIPKGAALFMPQIIPNRDPSVYAPDPEAFRPERWSSPNSKEMQQGLVTFALGNRNCIGQSLALAEINSVLPRLLSSYSFELVAEGTLDYFLTLKFSGARLKATRLRN